jgi:ADP-heptose:LPS heptosyltransferase
MFPSAKIDLIVGRAARIAVAASDVYGELYTIDHFVLNRANRGRLSKIRTYLDDRRRFLETVRNRQYDIGIDLYPYFPPAGPLFWRADIPVRCGFTSGGFSRLLTHPVAWTYQDKPIGRYGRDLISALWPERAKSIGEFSSYDPNLPRSELPSHVAPPAPAYIVLHVGAGAAWREWPDANWRSLIEMWGTDAPMLVICGTGPREGERARRVAAHSVTGRTMLFLDKTWDDFTALVAGAAGLVCLESAAGHVAARFSVPTVAIYTGVNEHRFWGPDNPNARVLAAPTGCAPCHRTDCPAMACIRNISPGDVLEALDGLGLRKLQQMASGSPSQVHVQPELRV